MHIAEAHCKQTNHIDGIAYIMGEELCLLHGPDPYWAQPHGPNLAGGWDHPPGNHMTSQ